MTRNTLSKVWQSPTAFALIFMVAGGLVIAAVMVAVSSANLVQGNYLIAAAVFTGALFGRIFPLTEDAIKAQMRKSLTFFLGPMVGLFGLIIVIRYFSVYMAC